jgi:ribosome-binding factor A
MLKTRKTSQRALRVAEQIQRDVAEMVQREISTTRAGLITISGVELAPDYAHAKVFFTVLGAAPEAAAHVLNEKAGYFHSLLYKRMSTHTVPRLVFVHDTSVEQGFALDQLISRATGEHTGEHTSSAESGSLKPKE